MNTLTNLAADIYRAADTVGREVVGFIPSATVNAETARVAVNDTVRSHSTRAATAGDITAAMTIPEGTDQVVDSKTMTIDKARSVQIPWTGEEIVSVNNGAGFETIYGDQIAQAMRTLTNEVENDLANAAYQGASRATGVAGTTPFASNMDLIAETTEILRVNGAPQNDGRMSLVLSNTAGTKLRNLAQLQKANEAGNDTLLRQGILLDLQGCMLRESGQIGVHTAGTGTSYLLNDASSAVGDTTIAVDGGTGTVLAGDVITFAGTSDIYAVNTALSGGSLSIGTPGLLAAETDDDAITVGSSYTPNVLFHQGALELAIRAPATPDGDAAVDTMMIQDPHSGLVFEIRVYKGYRKAMFEVACAWGVKAWKSDNIAILMG
ncbi:MAG: P22 coat - protein 5 family protein [Candidatus Jacksonbacteria bacterium]|nr:P22 coat - protein 5 family protein [Candidatus Jacksonbacteria bacterium]